MNISLPLAKKLLLLINGESIAASKLKHSIIDDLIKEGILHKPGKRNSIIQLANKELLNLYLQNHYQINNLELYARILQEEDINRTDLIAVANDSKIKYTRSFKGFLVNSYTPINATLNNIETIILPTIGTFNFIYDFENFEVEKDVTIIGVENPTNFRYIEKQKHLFEDFKPLFVSRYPQNQGKDLIKWLQVIPNKYLHFGDFDFAGINIYVNEFKKHLGDRAIFFMPSNIDELLKKFGSNKRYNNQKISFGNNKISEENILQLIQFIHQSKKGLDQEILIK
jgi:hypothetical protein